MLTLFIKLQLSLTGERESKLCQSIWIYSFVIDRFVIEIFVIDSFVIDSF